MDRDLALKLAASLANIKSSVTALATNTTPTAADSRSVSPAENQRSVPAELPTAEPEADPEEPETRTNK